MRRSQLLVRDSFRPLRSTLLLFPIDRGDCGDCGNAGDPGEHSSETGTSLPLSDWYFAASTKPCLFVNSDAGIVSALARSFFLLFGRRLRGERGAVLKQDADQVPSAFGAGSDA